MSVHEGENILCPACGAQSFVKSRLVLSDDWSSKRKVLVCAFCNAELGKADEQTPQKSAEPSGGTSRLAALLSDDVEEKVNIKIDVQQGDEKLCRNCRHLAVHPFKNVCLISQKEVDTMDDCEKFELKNRG